MTPARALQSELTAIRGELRRALERLDRLVAPPGNDPSESLDAWCARWLGARGSARPEDERRQYEIWIAPSLGQCAVASITRDDVERWVENIDAQVSAGRLRSGTATRIWSMLRAMLRDACSSKVRAIRVRLDNPAAGVRGPDESADRAATFLYPSEFLQLVQCPEVPLVFRRLYALTVYLYPRAGELRALEWSDVDVSGRVHIHASETRARELGRTKTETDRQFVAERTLMPLLRAMRRESGGHGRVCQHIPQRQNLARALRQHMREADLDRADLYADDEGRRPLTYHDLRATGITWQAMRGDSPTDIMERVGHADLRTTQRYIRRGKLLAVRRERVFPPLPECLLKKER